ncbi:MAG: lipopolysaccharide kinase InaA family protein [Planctomycetota bacterium]|nr:lipopolysaccharide kinase InaA family protein [Planctomycetota bacterium]
MSAPPGESIRVIRAGSGVDPALATELGGPGWTASARLLKREGGSAVYEGASSVGRLVVKVMTLDRPKDALSRLAGVTRLGRQWRGSERLAQLGFQVARPLLLWRGRGPQGKLVEALAMERLEGNTALELLAQRGRCDPDTLRRIARRIGTDVGRMSALGVYNRDHKPSNLLVMSLDADLRVAVLDTVAIRRARLGSRALARRRMLFALAVEPLGTGILPGVGVRLTVMRACARAAGLPASVIADDWRAVARMLERHKSPVPRTDPLARPTDAQGAH